MLRQKTFIFRSYDLYDVDRIVWKEDNINNKIDNFLKGKELVSLNTTYFCGGNNPPIHALIYTIVYKEGL